ncbi:UMP kinase [Halobacteriales archaeon SW_7_68_16]|nr:MAG: UMP kinase [Halobacteriales archaeon SW_7_68_16]
MSVVVSIGGVFAHAGNGSTWIVHAMRRKRELGANEIELDGIGIATTRLNARLLATGLDGVTDSPAADYEDAAERLRTDGLAVLGGVAPAQTTDAVAAALAEYVDADLLVYATSVAGVYAVDPEDDPDAERYDTMTADELVSLVVEMEMDAGSSAPVDLLAAKIIDRAGMRAIVLDGTDPEAVLRAVEDGEFDGTEIGPGAENQRSLAEYEGEGR